MTEWGVVGVIVVLVGLIGTFVKSGVSMSKSSQRLSDSVDGLKQSIDELKDDNRDFHNKLADHETRITVMEHERNDRK